MLVFTESYTSSTTGNNKQLVPTGTVLDGNNGDNYDITFVNTTNGAILRKAITVTAATNTKTYDGTKSAAAFPTITLGSIEAGDTANFTEVYSTRNAGSALTLVPSGTVMMLMEETTILLPLLITPQK